MKPQDFKNHSRLVPLYHGVTAFLLLMGIIGAVVNFIQAITKESSLLQAILFLLFFVIAFFFFWFIRSFALGAQDRAIRAEENLRYYSLTGKLFDSRLTLGQIIALRFAPDEELIALAERAISENLSQTNIKQVIKNWKADYHRI